MTFFIAIAALACTLLFLRKLINRQLILYAPEKQVILQQKLRPVELAYLFRHGDISHATTVMAADLIQRAVKNQLTGSVSTEIAPYESKMWTIVIKSVKDWTTQKAYHLFAKDIQKDPLRSAKHLPNLYKFLAKTAQQFLRNVIQDPRHIKRYFSFRGVLKLIADFFSAGYQKTLETELVSDLIDRGLLAPDSRKMFFSKLYLLIALSGLVISFLCAQISLADSVLALTVSIMSFGGAAFLRFLLTLRAAIPLYTEAALVLDQVNRKSWRLVILKTILHSLSVFTFVLVLLSFIVLMAIDYMVASAIFHAGTFMVLCHFAVLTVGSLPLINLIVEAFALTCEQRPTLLAERELAQCKSRLSHLSPLISFKQMLQSADYDPQFSELLALYGTEILLLLA